MILTENNDLNKEKNIFNRTKIVNGNVNINNKHTKKKRKYRIILNIITRPTISNKKKK